MPKRELKADVLRLHDKGLPPAVIAERLGCRPEYVRTALRRVGLKGHGVRPARRHVTALVEISSLDPARSAAAPEIARAALKPGGAS